MTMELTLVGDRQYAIEDGIATDVMEVPLLGERARRRKELMSLLFELVGMFSDQGYNALGHGPIRGASDVLIGLALQGAVMEPGFAKFMGSDYPLIQGPTKKMKASGAVDLSKIEKMMLLLRRFCVGYMCDKDTSPEIEQFDDYADLLYTALGVYLDKP